MPEMNLAPIKRKLRKNEQISTEEIEDLIREVEFQRMRVELDSYRDAYVKFKSVEAMAAYIDYHCPEEGCYDAALHVAHDLWDDGARDSDDIDGICNGMLLDILGKVRW